MEDLKDKAAGCGLADRDLADLAIGGYLSVLKHSESLEAGVLDDILAFLGKDGGISMKQYEKNAGHSIHLPTIHDVPVLGNIFSALTANHGKKDKDAEHTKAMVDLLIQKFEGFTQENLVKFMKVFVAYVQNEVTAAVDIDSVLKMPK